MRPLEDSRISKPIVLRVGPELDTRITKAMKEKGLTRSELLRRATELFLDMNPETGE